MAEERMPPLATLIARLEKMRTRIPHRARLIEERRRKRAYASSRQREIIDILAALKALQAKEEGNG